MSSLYQIGALIDIEHQVDSINEIFVEKLCQFSYEHKSFDMAEWLQFYAFDAIGALAVRWKVDSSTFTNRP